jgi:two-component system, cell cycle sensor histidine kinase PleC
MLRSELHGPHSHPRYKNYAEIIEDAARYMESLCSGILDYAKARSDQFSLDLEPVDLCELARECADMVRAPAVQAKLSLTLETAQSPLLVIGDPVRLKQCMLNLLSNAMKFTPVEGEIRLTATPAGPGLAGLWVADTGVGIAPDELERAMAPFCQTSARAQSGHTGAGLGLPITKQIVERHGGTLTLTSALGQGTTAAILLPEA